MITRGLQNEMRCAVHSCHHLGKSAPEAINMMKEAYKEDYLGKLMIFWWHKAFSEGRKLTEFISFPGRPVSSSNEVKLNTILALIQENRQITEAEIGSINKTKVLFDIK